MVARISSRDEITPADKYGLYETDRKLDGNTDLNKLLTLALRLYHYRLYHD